MPSSSLTYDTPYNRKLKSLLDEMDAKHWNNGTSQYHPSMMGFKLSNFHGDYSGEPSAKMMVGGGSHGDQKFVHSGNSPAYPPHMMSSGMLVNSGGARIGIDGAVGGRQYSLGDFGHDVAHIAKDVGPDVIRAMMASKGAGRRKKGGSKIGDQIASVAKTLAPFAPLLMGLGRPLPKSKADIVDALKELGAKKSHTLKQLKELAMSGGAKYSFGDFAHDVASIGKEVAPDLIRASLAKGAGRKKKSATGGLNLKDVLDTPIVKQMSSKVSDLVKSADPAISTAKKIVGKVKSAVGAGRGRSARTAIVKKVMKDRGVSMIEASRITKAEGLY